jgi:hypothetical protein
LALPLYILSLGVSGGLLGVLARRVLAIQGFAPTFESGLYVAACAGLAFAFLQVAYATLLRFLKPTHDNVPLFGEALSNLSAVVLVPYLLGVQIPWPVSALKKVEILIFLGLFVGIHLFFKLTALFAATESRIAGRLGTLGWAAACVLIAFGVERSFDQWRHALDAARVTALPTAEAAHAGPTHTMARRVSEGLAVPIDAEGHAGQTLVLRWAQPIDVPEPPQRIYVTLRVEGQETPLLRQVVDLLAGDWVEMRIPADTLQGHAGAMLTWSAEDEPVWVAYTGVRAVAMSNQQVMLSGPWWHRPLEGSRAPSVIVVLAEGLGARHLGSLGYGRAATPSLDALAAESFNFRNAFSPAPDAAAASMSLLTGLPPLSHGFLGAHEGPLPDGVDTLAEALQAQQYATAAFTEGDATGDRDLVYGSGFERGFEVFDQVYPTARGGRKGGAALPAGQMPASAGVTLDKAANWIESHANDKFFVFIRLRELRAPQWLERYGTGFIGSISPAPVDIYDTALLDVDKQLGLFLDRLRALPAYDQTAVVVTSSNGFEFSGAWRTHFNRQMTEATMHVPLLMKIPGEPRRMPTLPCDLEDLAPTLAQVTGATFRHAVVGDNLLDAGEPQPPVSMWGDPLVLSLRNDAWRLTWQSGRAPFSAAMSGTPKVVALLELARYRAGQYQYADVSRREGALVQRLGSYLENYLLRNTYTPPAAATTTPALQAMEPAPVALEAPAAPSGG